VIGEVALKSDCMLTEYYHRPDATDQSLHARLVSDGDYGYKVGDQVYVTGRKKEMIIVGGKNVYPMDLEELAMTVPGVHAGRVVALGCSTKNPAPKRWCWWQKSRRNHLKSVSRSLIPSGRL